MFHNKNTNIPSFSYKSALLILLSAVLGCFLIPYIFQQFNVNWKGLFVLTSSIIPAYTTAYCLYFIESNQRFNRSFFITFVLLSFIIGFISFFWIYDLIYI